MVLFAIWVLSPFVAVDEAYFEDSDMSNQADGRFKWDTFNSGAISDNTIKGVKLDHFMPKWDSLSRDNKQRPIIATANARIFKDESLLKTRLQESASSQITVIATWNDMGEGTGITRNYDYFAGGVWLEPDAFIKDILATQCSNYSASVPEIRSPRKRARARSVTVARFGHGHVYGSGSGSRSRIARFAGFSRLEVHFLFSAMRVRGPRARYISVFSWPNGGRAGPKIIGKVQPREWVSTRTRDHRDDRLAARYPEG